MTYSFDYLKEDNLIAKVSVDDKTVSVENYTDDIVDRPFGTCTNPGFEELERLYEERCFPESRANAKQILKDKPYGYDRLSIIQDTHGVLLDDCYWVRFDYEDLSWNDVKSLRNF